MRKLRAPTAKSITVNPVWPNEGVRQWYENRLDALIARTAIELQSAITVAWNKAPSLFHSHITAADSVVRAAGVWFTVELEDEPEVHLLLHRTDGSGWAFPGGHVEDDESDEDAVIREVMEETGHVVRPWALAPADETRFGAIHFTTYHANAAYTFVPKLNDEHDAFTWATIGAALNMPLHPGVRATLSGTPDIVGDATSPTKTLQIAMQRWGTDAIKRFDAMAEKIANDFATRNAQATEVAMRAQLKKAGFSVAFRPTPESIEAYRLVAATNVALIKSIPRKYHDQVVQKVWAAVQRGSDLHTLSADLHDSHGVTRKRAALIARDQNAKAKATIERTRQIELGLTHGFWLHSHAGKCPRPVHVAADGMRYDLRKGIWDKDEQAWVHPGELIECRCTMKPEIPGFEY